MFRRWRVAPTGPTVRVSRRIVRDNHLYLSRSIRLVCIVKLNLRFRTRITQTLLNVSCFLFFGFVSNLASAYETWKPVMNRFANFTTRSSHRFCRGWPCQIEMFLLLLQSVRICWPQWDPHTSSADSVHLKTAPMLKQIAVLIEAYRRLSDPESALRQWTPISDYYWESSIVVSLSFLSTRVSPASGVLIFNAYLQPDWSNRTVWFKLAKFSVDLRRVLVY